MKTTLACFVAVMVVSTRSIAADYPQRAALGAQSASVGVGKATVPLLQRQVGPGANVIGSQLLAHFASSSAAITTGGNYKTTQNAAKVDFSGDDGWKLTVYGDGSAVEFRNWPYRTAHLIAVPPAQQPTLDTLETWGRNFINQNLAGVISLGPNEQLVQSHARFESQGYATAADRGPAATSIVGAIVVFSRTINGTALVGYGSKIAVRFTVDGTPWAFSYDWPSYSNAGVTQAVLSLATIRQRQSKLLQAPAKAIGQKEMRFECGYFDPGVRHRDPNALVQGGCMSVDAFTEVGDPARYAADPTNGLVRSGSIVVIPAGATMAADKSWPEIGVLQGNGATQAGGRVTLPNTTQP